MPKSSLIFPLVVCSIVPCLHGQSASDLNEGAQVVPSTTPDHYLFSWWGKQDRFYVIEHSTDLLSPWDHIPAIEPGYDDVAQWGFATNADKFFLRLKYTDDALTGAFHGDDDLDGIINGVELLLGYSAVTANGNSDGDLLTDRQELALGLDPDDNSDAVDSDGDGVVDAIERLYGLSTSGTTDLDGDSMDDEWELIYYLDLTIDDSGLDPDGDGLTNLQEFNEGTNPWAFDTDGDTLPDGLEVSNSLDPLTADLIHTRNNYAWQFTTDLTDRFSEFSDRISESSTHSLALDKDGNVYAWGTNEFGQLGLGSGTANTGDVADPAATQFSSSRSISAGYGTSHVVTTTGTAEAAGDNAGGLLGIGSNPLTQPSPVDVPSTVSGLSGEEVFRISGKYGHLTGLDGHREAIAGSDEEIYAWGILIGSNYTGPTYTRTAEGPKKSLSGLVSLSSGYTSATLGPTVAVDESGDVYAWGINSEYRSLGHPNASFSTSRTASYEISPLPAASYANAKYGYGATAGTDGQISVWGLFRGRSGLDYITSNNQQGTPVTIAGTLGARGVAIPLMVEEDTGSGIKPVEKPGFYLDAEGQLQMFYWKTEYVEGTNPVQEFGEIKTAQIRHTHIFVGIAEAYEGVFLLSANGEVFKYTP